MMQVEAPKAPKPHFLADGLPKIVRRGIPIVVATGITYSFFRHMSESLARHNATMDTKYGHFNEVVEAVNKSDSLIHLYKEAYQQHNVLESLSQAHPTNHLIKGAAENALTHAKNLDSLAQNAEVSAFLLKKKPGFKPEGFLPTFWEGVKNFFNWAGEAIKAPIEWIGGAGHLLSQRPMFTLAVILAYSVAKEIGKIQKLEDNVMTTAADYLDAALNVLGKTASVSAVTILVAAVLDPWLSQLGANNLWEALSKAWPVANKFVIASTAVVGFASLGKLVMLQVVAGKERKKKPAPAAQEESAESADVSDSAPLDLGGGPGIQA